MGSAALLYIQVRLDLGQRFLADASHTYHLAYPSKGSSLVPVGYDPCSQCRADPRQAL